MSEGRTNCNWCLGADLAAARRFNAADRKTHVGTCINLDDPDFAKVSEVVRMDTPAKSARPSPGSLAATS